MQSFYMQSLEGEQQSRGAESAIAPRLAAARMAWLAENLVAPPQFTVSGTKCPTVPSFQWGGEYEGTKRPKGQRDAALALAKRTSQHPRGRRPLRRGAVVRLA